MTIALFDIHKQLTRYWTHHSHPVTRLVHALTIPFLFWSFQILCTVVPLPSFIPRFVYKFNDSFEFSLNFPAIWICSSSVYCFVLEPMAALLFLPQAAFALLHATAFAHRPDAMKIAGGIHVFCFIVHDVIHRITEKPALTVKPASDPQTSQPPGDPVSGAILEWFLCHFVVLFALGYRPDFYRDVKNSAGVEIARMRKLEGDEKRAKEAKSF